MVADLINGLRELNSMGSGVVDALPSLRIMKYIRDKLVDKLTLTHNEACEIVAAFDFTKFSPKSVEDSDLIALAEELAILTSRMYTAFSANGFKHEHIVTTLGRNFLLELKD